MDHLKIKGGIPLNGTVSASGSKNSALPLLAATILLNGETVLHNVPNLSDIAVMIKILNSLGMRVEACPDNQVKIWNEKKIRHIAPYDLVTSMRASFFVAGPILAKTGFAKVPLPGGCLIGSRPIDIHLKGFQDLGAEIKLQNGFVELRAKKLKAARIYLNFPSVGATENLMMAASLVEGVSYIENAALEPEIDDLADILNKAGAKITGVGTRCIKIEGVSELKGVSHHVIPDRVEAGTLLIAGAITGGDVTVTNLNVDHLEPLIRKLKDCGFGLTIDGNSIRVIGKKEFGGATIETLPFPGFPTDLQAQMMAILSVANGTSIIKETIFENRFMHAYELKRMGADIKIDGNHAFIKGVEKLSAAPVKITDLRAGAALILAGLRAEGTTVVHGLKHLRRGYQGLPEKLGKLGASVFV
ncbi:UDP-N-acetylglucosamine 1-carboxyvinyltransferase [bacterium]|jgi:UDP-N-acetylglucosamine 1-carboxyvinyltransferase|nr:UDP-N-acetylglucosamine 1-carboxyvinyltransferase [bacterium]